MDPGLQRSINEFIRVVDSAGVAALEQNATVPFGAGLGSVAAALAAHIDSRLAVATRTVAGSAALAATLESEHVPVVLAWACTSAGRGDLTLAPLLGHLGRRLPGATAVSRAARSRVERGPYHDALGCLVVAGIPNWIDEPSATRGRLELLLWRAGVELDSRRDLAPWLFGSSIAVNRLLVAGSRGSLRSRSLAARTMCVVAEGTAAVSMESRARAERIAADLARHPEPSVWIPATRALGRLASANESTSALLHLWAGSENATLRRRGTAALACDSSASTAVRDHLTTLLDREEDPWVIAALGPAAPLLARDRRDIWEKLGHRLLGKRWGAEVVWSVTQGLVALGEPSALDRLSLELLAEARARAHAVEPKGTAEAMLWHSIRRSTDFLDGLEPDPSDLDLLLERTALAATRVLPATLADRARALTAALAATIETSQRVLAAARSVRERAAALVAVEGTARAFALGLWEPLLMASGASLGASADELGRVDASLVALATGLSRSPDADFATARAGLRVLAATIDRCEPSSSGAGPALGRAALLASTLPCLGSPRRREREALRKPLGELAWRAANAFSQTSAPRNALPHLVLWWTLAAEPSILKHIAHVDPAFTEEQVTQFLNRAALVRHLLDPKTAPRAGSLGAGLSSLLDDFQATDTVLAAALYHLVDAVARAQEARRGTRDERHHALLLLANVRLRLLPVLKDPLLALGTVEPPLPPQDPGWLEDALAVAGRSVKQRASGVAKWAADLGPVVGPFLAAAVDGLLASFPLGSPGSGAKRVGPYELRERLGAGAMGEVWLVNSMSTHREFVMKIASGALEDDSPDSRAHLRAALTSESEVLRSLYHPNVASFIDYGWDEGVAYLVLERLRGVDLEQALRPGPLTLSTLRPIVADVCAGLGALHRNGLVHRDLKPGNVFLRLDDAPADSPIATRFRSAVVIDFGITGRMTRGGGEGYVLGTPGYMPPEQARGEAIDEKADVYSLAATVYSALTGRAFFDHVDAERAILLHGAMAPFAPGAPHDIAPHGLRLLLAEATSLEPSARPTLADFVRGFSRATATA